PAPVPEPVLVERLRPGAADEGLPVHRLGVDVVLRPLDAVAVAVPGQVDLHDAAEPAGLEQVAGLGDVRHAPLLGADLHHALVLVLGVDDGPALAEFVRQRLFNIDVLVGGAGVHGDGDVPVVRGGDQDGVHVLAVEHGPVVAGGERLLVGPGAAGLEVGREDIADGGDADVGHLDQRLHQVAAAAAAADQADVEGLVGPEGAGGGGGQRQGGGGGEEVA